jgi:Crp-like helix-turn-helix domain
MFIAHLLARAIRVEADLVDQLFNSSEKRLARLLLLLANFGKEEKPEPILAKISQETLADMIGTTRSRVSFFMNKFRSEAIAPDPKQDRQGPHGAEPAQQRCWRTRSGRILRSSGSWSRKASGILISNPGTQFQND